MMPGPRRRRLRNRRRRRLRQGDIDQPLGNVAWVPEIDAQAAQQHRPERKLNEPDRGERIGALPRPDNFFMLRVSGNRLPASTL
jgi:hypothetical protein